MQKEVKERNTYLDLLKVVAIFLVVMFHVYDGVFVNDKYNTIIDFFTFIFSYLSGNTGNVIFITISAYYLIKSKGPKLSKIIFLMLIQTITAIIMLIPISIYKIDNVNIYYLKRTLFPFFAGASYWYINAYIIYYMLHGHLNRLIENISKREHKIIVLLSLFYFMVLPMFFFRQLENLSYFTSFIVIHFLVSYIDKYMQNFDFKKSTIILSALYLLILIFVFLLDIVLKTNRFKLMMTLNMNITRFYNLLLVLLIVSLVFNTKNINMKPSAFIYNVSSLALWVYLIHCYEIPKISITADIFEKNMWAFLDGRYSYVVDRLFYFGAAVLYFFINVVLAYIYKMIISPILNPISDKIANLISKTWLKLEEKYDKNDK